MIKILESEKDGYNEIKSHFDLLKDCIINMPLEIKTNKKMNNSIENGNPNKENENNNNNNNSSYDLLYGNTNIMELKKRIVQKNSLIENSIIVTLCYKEKGSLKTKILDSSYNNKSLKELLDIEKKEKPKDNNKRSSYRLSFTGDVIEKEPLIKSGDINPKFAKMIRKWFYFFSNGNEIMDKDNVINFLSFMNQRKDINEFSDEYVRFMGDNEDYILEENFVEYYNGLARKDPDKVWDNIKLMKYEKFFEKTDEDNQIVDRSYLPRYILGNDQNFFDALSKLYMKFEKKLPIVEFLFFLCTNENKYNELLENFDVLFNNKNNNNHLELLYD